MAPTNIYGLPPELIEQALIISAALGVPSSIAHFSQTNRYFYSLIYRREDAHLWREAFLAMFDDPRGLGRVLGVEIVSYDWKSLFINRMLTQKFMRFYTSLEIPPDQASWNISLQAILETLASYVETASPFPNMPTYFDLTGSTSTPPSFPMTVFLCTPPNHFPTSLASSNSAHLDPMFNSGWPIVLQNALLPVASSSFRIQVAGDTIRIPSASSSTRAWPSSSPTDPIFAPLGRGLSPPSDRSSEFDTIRTTCSRLLHKLAFYKGILPMPYPVPPRLSGDLMELVTARQAVDDIKGKIRAKARTVVYNLRYLRKNRSWGPYLLSGAKPESKESTSDDPPPRDEGAGVGGEELTSNPRPHHISYSVQFEDDGDDDDYEPSEDLDGAVDDAIDNFLSHQRDHDSDSNEEDLFELGVIDLDDPTTHPPFEHPENPLMVIPDYQFLAAARVVVEANLEELLTANMEDDDDEIPDFELDGKSPPNSNHDAPTEDVNELSADPDQQPQAQARYDVIAAAIATGTTPAPTEVSEVLARKLSNEMRKNLVGGFRKMDLLRMGSAPGFSWAKVTTQEDGTPELRKGWGMESLDASEDDKVGGIPESSGNGKGKERETDYPGWDWAGVDGEWRRTVCWLDYRDLLLHNLGSPAYDAGDLSETTRIFPMTLHISGYSPPPTPPSESASVEDGPQRHPNTLKATLPVEDLIYKLPIIHIEGTSKGSDVDSQVLRKIKGTVRMIGEGGIRWSLTSSHPDSDLPEWVTEGVQVGGIGSAAGILGLWTGAEHVRSDPIGPFWAWKVG
ncbi:hypothetical protein BDN72DRAFT_877343 [Pluteus cervinus]|uniref:Uncharacterized protein n=1 Tax=Pluteus cervinus TaxID=181527 RepID=A0ACD3B0Q6_9AGAR|nr:hypothetical protein BDN72DRAFT_877343 [Pluteus cervinus]